MSANYQCPNCGQIVPVIGLDETGPVHCPSCQGAIRSGPPPVPSPPTSDAHIVQPIPPWRAESAAPARWDDDGAEIDIRRHEMLPVAAPPAAQSSGRVKHVVWPLLLVGFVLLRLFGYAMRHDQPHVQAPQFNMPQMQFQVPNPGGVDEPPRHALIQRATWSEKLPDGLRAAKLLLSGPINPRIGIVAKDRAAAETSFIGFDGDTGAHAGRIVWKASVRPLRFSLSDDGSRLAVLLQDAGKAAKRFQLYALPQGNAVGDEWYPFPPANAGAAADDLWFEMLGPDRLLTFFQQRRLELWSVPDGKRLYSIDVEPAPENSRHAVALSPDRCLVAIAKGTRGFTFHDTANGAAQGRTAVVPAQITHLDSCAFSPDGTQFGCQLTVADPPQQQWIMWSCADGAIEAQWHRAKSPWLFWDAQHVLSEGSLNNARNGMNFAVVDGNDANLMVASTGRRLWYVCREPFGLIPAAQVASIVLQPEWFQNPAANFNAFRRWSLRPDGLSAGP